MAYAAATEGLSYSAYCRSSGVLPSFEGFQLPEQEQSPGSFGFTTKFGRMAKKAKRLVCFYCNKKSNERFIGQQEWTCATCEAVNYLDESGDITDPPVAVDNPPTYTGLLPAPSIEHVDISESQPFCMTCIKNQHLFTSSLQQFHVETDPLHPDYRASERAYYKYKKTLEETYPQVCEDCHPRVLACMKAASKTAKSDFLFKSLEKTRTIRSAVYSFTTLDLIVFLGKLLFYIGIFGQLSWNISALLLHLEVIPLETRYSSYLGKFMAFTRPFTTLATSYDWARYSRNCSLAAFWWNPKFKEFNNGFRRHINGISGWYKFQLIHIAIRLLFYYIIRTSLLSDPRADLTIGAHFVASLFFLLVATRSNCKVKVDMEPLWNSTPEKLPYVGPRSSSPGAGNMGSMADVLNEISATSSTSNKQPAPNSENLHARGRSHHEQSPQNSQAFRHQIPHDSSSSNQFSNSSTLYGQQNQQEYNYRTPYGSGNGYQSINNSTLYGQQNRHNQKLSYSSGGGNLYQSDNKAPLYSQTYFSRADDEMEWSPPPIPQKQNIAFKPRQPQPEPNPIGEQLPTRPSPFYGRLPEAPYSPAHRLRNPPNQARLRVPSQEVKENFFKNITRRVSDPKSTTENTEDTTKREMNLAQQRFFPPTPPSEAEAGNVLADLLTSFSLSTTETNATAVVESRSSRTQHLWQALSLMLGMIIWNSSMDTEHARNVMLVVLAGCLILGVRTLLDNTVFNQQEKSSSGYQNSFGNCVAFFGSVAALYGLFEIYASGEVLENWAAFGTQLTGGMLVYEILAMSFGD